ncbi:MAG: helix-turn-helix transcriptional regulator [Oscillospiraceae bacterium]|nr:helix-turn-helix transcriptional regulator [Oscillospiraceae bacterium]
MGSVIITLDEYRTARGISKYRIIKNCDVSATQLNSYLNNRVTRIDLPVLARICDYLGCDVGDILHYRPDTADIPQTGGNYET